MTTLKGVEDIGFKKCYELAEKYEIEEIVIRVLHLNHLIVSKKAANHPKDQIDIIEFRKASEDVQ